MASLIALLFVGLVAHQAQAPASENTQERARQGQVASASGNPQKPGEQPQKPASASPVSPDDVPIDLDRIRKDLQHPDLLKLDIPSSLPEGSTRYKVQVQGYSFKLPTLAESLHIPWAPSPPGGLYNYEIMQMITPEAVRGSAPFTNSEMAWVAVTSLASALAMRGVTSAYQSARSAWRTWQEEQAREEVQRELAEFLRQQALRQAAAKKEPDKKDPDKKQPDKKAP